MKRMIATMFTAGLIFAGTACTPEEIEVWRSWFAEQEAACTEVLADKVGMDIDYVAPKMIVWHNPNTGDLIGFAQYEDSRIWPTEECARVMPVY